MKQYDLVSQEDAWGCGAACVASLLGISYRKAKQLVEKEKKLSLNAEPCGIELHHIAIALQKAGIKVIADWTPAEIPVGTIACIGDEAHYKDEHYLLKTAKGWMDPWYNLDVNNMSARYREDYPKGTELLVALVPVAA